MLIGAQVKPVKVSGASIRVNFFDFAGGPEYFDIRSEFYKDAQGCLLVYDVGGRGAFDALEARDEHVPLHSPARGPSCRGSMLRLQRRRAGLDRGGECTWTQGLCDRRRWQQIGKQKVACVSMSGTK